MTAAAKPLGLIEKLESFLRKYVTFSEEGVAFPIALWSIATYLHQEFDTFAYMVITSLTKRSGKTRLSEIIGFTCNNPLNQAAMTPAAMYNKIDPVEPPDQFIPPTVIFDEAEVLGSEAANNMRAVLNAGYRKGQFVSRVIGKTTRDFKVYCPKIFILIGDVFDTLNDRSIVIRLTRRDSKCEAPHFHHDSAKAEGAEIIEQIKREIVSDPKIRAAILSAYLETRLPFLSDRDEEIWSPLFALCKVLTPQREKELQRIAVDLCALKTAEKQVATKMGAFESAANQAEFGVIALRDLHKVMDGSKVMFSDVAIEKLKGLPLSPWRTFKGAGLSQNGLADLLKGFGVEPGIVRSGKEVRRGYKAANVQKALQQIGKGGFK